MSTRRNDSYFPVLSPPFDPYASLGSPRRTVGDAFIPPVDPSQAPFLQTPTTPQLYPLQQLDQQQQQASKKQFPIGFKRHRHKAGFKWAFWIGLAALLFGAVITLVLVSIRVNSEVTSVSNNENKAKAIALFGKVNQVDLSNSQISIKWEVRDAMENFAPPLGMVNIFMNENCSAALHSNDSGLSGIMNFNDSLRVGSHNGTDQEYLYYDKDEKTVEENGTIMAFEPFFETTLPFRISKLISSRVANDLAYPFDHYDANSIFCASYFPFLDDTTQLEYADWIVLTVQIGGYGSKYNAISSWTITSTERAVRPDAKALRYFSTVIRRSWVVIAFAAIIWITNWLITIVVVVQTALVYVWKRETSESIVLVPLTALFSMPAVRGVAPGAPAFGSYYDITGFNPQVSIVSLCTALILAKTLHSSEHVWTRGNKVENEVHHHYVQAAPTSSARKASHRSSSKSTRPFANQPALDSSSDSDDSVKGSKVPQPQVAVLGYNS